MTTPHYRIGKATGAAATVLLALIATAAQATTTNQPCTAAVERHLQSQGLEAGAIEHSEIIAIVPNREFGTPSEYQAWTSLKSCSGSLVTKLTTTCRVKESYSRGDCRFPGARRN